jgi:hypothetical protein
VLVGILKAPDRGSIKNTPECDEHHGELFRAFAVTKQGEGMRYAEENVVTASVAADDVMIGSLESAMPDRETDIRPEGNVETDRRICHESLRCEIEVGSSEEDQSAPNVVM